MNICGIAISENTTSIWWRHNLNQVYLTIENLSQMSVAEACEMIFVLKCEADTPKKNAPDRLLAYNYGGEELFAIMPPENYLFYRLDFHTQSPAGVAVVCQGESDPYGRMDWYFGINPKTGKLTKIGLAY